MYTAIAAIITAGAVTSLFAVMGRTGVGMLELHVELGTVRFSFTDRYVRYRPGTTQRRDGQCECKE
jgi:hypothetical protein